MDFFELFKVGQVKFIPSRAWGLKDLKYFEVAEIVDIFWEVFSLVGGTLAPNLYAHDQIFWMGLNPRGPVLKMIFMALKRIHFLVSK